MDLTPAIKILEEKIVELQHARKTLLELVPAKHEAAPAPKAPKPKGTAKRKRPGSRGVPSPEKPCKECKVVKPLDEFPRNPSYRDKHTNTCKVCTNRRVAARSAGVIVEPAAVSEQEGKFVCTLCNSPCSSAERLARHMQTVHKREV